MIEWEEALARVDPIHDRGNRCPCGGRRELVRQALDCRRGIDTTVWECVDCKKGEKIETPVSIPGT